METVSHSSNINCPPSRKSDVVFFSQVILIYIVVICSLINISLGSSLQLWIILLTSCLGYLLPNPSLKTVKLSQPSST